jgi:hypothetical protein
MVALIGTEIATPTAGTRRVGYLCLMELEKQAELA